MHEMRITRTGHAAAPPAAARRERLHADRGADRRHGDVVRRRGHDAGVRRRGPHHASAHRRSRSPSSRRRPSSSGSPTLPYGELALTASPLSSSDPHDPGVQGLRHVLHRPRGPLGAARARPPATGRDADASSPARRRSRSAPRGGDHHRQALPLRQLARRDCPLSLCEGGENTKRVTVAATLDPRSAPSRAAARVGLDDRGRPGDRPRRARRHRPEARPAAATR